MSSESDEQTLSVQIANQIIGVANKRLEAGLPAVEIANGLRHAAANFSAFADANSSDKDLDPNALAEEFLQTYAYYLERHRPQKTAPSNLDALIRQAQEDF